MNEITPWIDGGLTYGVAKAWADALRSFKDGKLAKSEKGNWPEENELGLPMANPPLPSVHQLRKVSRFFSMSFKVTFIVTELKALINQECTRVDREFVDKSLYESLYESCLR